MPYVKKSEYEKLKMLAGCYRANLHECDKLNQENVELTEKLANATEVCALRKQANFLLSKAYDSLDWEVKRWKRYYQAAIKTFKIQEYVEMPGCFNPMESIEYIVKQQADEHERLEKEVQNRQAC